MHSMHDLFPAMKNTQPLRHTHEYLLPPSEVDLRFWTLSNQQMWKIGREYPKGEFKTPIENFLNDIIRRGFLLHGSRFRLDELSPNPPFCNRRSGSCKNLLYATDVSAVALFYATVHRKPGTEGTIGCEPTENGKWRFTATPGHAIRTSGFVYAVDPRNFDINDIGEYICTKSIKMLQCYPVFAYDFGYPFHSKRPPLRF